MTGRPPSCDCGECPKCRHREYMREWYQRKTPEERRAWVARRDPAKVAASQKRYLESPKGRAKQRRNTERMRERHPLHYRARMAANNAIRDGKLTPGACANCGATTLINAHHHHGYEPEHWLDVQWLCTPCHNVAHREVSVDPKA